MKLRLVILLTLVALVAALIPVQTAVASYSDCHTVRPGETLSEIAARYGVRVSAIMRANGLTNPDVIYAGQCLIIPKSSSSSGSSTGICTTTYVVKRGDTLKSIAARYKVTVASIVAINDIDDPNLIYPGQKLTIKYKCSSKPAPKPAPSTGAWKGQYWNNPLLSGNPKYVRNARAVNFNWGNGGPGGGVGPDNFSVRWTIKHTYAAGTYRFHAQVDDGVRVFVDGQPVIDQWHVSAVKHYTADRQLNGTHTLQIDYFEKTGLASIKFWIEKVGGGAPSGAWLAEYFKNPTLEGSPAITRKEANIDYDWGAGPPLKNFRSDRFSVRWTRDVFFEAGTYKFTATSDDGVQVLIDGNMVIDQWHDSNGNTYHKDVQLSKGNHHIRVKYYEGYGNAKIRFSWTKQSGGGGGGPFEGKYFNNTKVEGKPAAVRHDEAINFNWGNKSPAPGVTADYFSVEWNANIHFKEGTYRFTVTMDDGMRLFVDDKCVIDAWHVAAVRSKSVDVVLSEGTHHIRVQYFENNGDAVAKLSWQRK